MSNIFDIKPTTRKIDILHPETEEPVGIKVTVRSGDDEAMKGIQRRITNRALELRKRNKTFSADEIEDNQINLVAAAIVDWDWTDSDMRFPDGSIPDFNARNVREVLENLPWFRSQIDEAIGEEKAFYKR